MIRIKLKMPLDTPRDTREFARAVEGAMNEQLNMDLLVNKAIKEMQIQRQPVDVTVRRWFEK